MTIKNLIGYTVNYGEYILVLSDRAQFWSIAEPVLDVLVSFASLGLAGVRGVLSLGLAAAYFTSKAGWYLANDKNMLTGQPLTNCDKALLVFDAVTSIVAAGAGLKILANSSKVPNTVIKTIKATDKGLTAIELSISALTGAYAIGNEQYGSGILLLGVAFLGVRGHVKSRSV